MTIETNQNSTISGGSAGFVRVGTGIASHSSNSGKQNAAIDRTTEAVIRAADLAEASAEEADRSEQVPIEDIVRLNDYVQTIRRRLEFRVDDTTNRTVVTVIDQETQEVIRQIPSETALKLARELSDFQARSGSLLDDQA